MRLNKFVEFGRKIIGVGRNYKAHVLEMGQELPQKPVIFLKPPTAYVQEGSPIRVPKDCKSLHHEVELGVVIARRGSNISPNMAWDYVGGYVLCLDMTARDFQEDAKKKGDPWCIPKGFDTSCPVGKFIPKERIKNINELNLWCKVNGEVRQQGSTGDMIFNIPDLVSYISSYFSLEIGDLILTGTPSGVGPVVPGDKIEAGLGEHSQITFNVEETSFENIGAGNRNNL